MPGFSQAFFCCIYPASKFGCYNDLKIRKVSAEKEGIHLLNKVIRGDETQ